MKKIFFLCLWVFMISNAFAFDYPNIPTKSVNDSLSNTEFNEMLGSLIYGEKAINPEDINTEGTTSTNILKYQVNGNTVFYKNKFSNDSSGLLSALSIYGGADEYTFIFDDMQLTNDQNIAISNNIKLVFVNGASISNSAILSYSGSILLGKESYIENSGSFAISGNIYFDTDSYINNSGTFPLDNIIINSGPQYILRGTGYSGNIKNGYSYPFWEDGVSGGVEFGPDAPSDGFGGDPGTYQIRLGLNSEQNIGMKMHNQGTSTNSRALYSAFSIDANHGINMVIYGLNSTNHTWSKNTAAIVAESFVRALTIATNGNSPIEFAPYDVVQAWMLPGGNFGLGIPTPSVRLEVADTTSLNTLVVSDTIISGGTIRRQTDKPNVSMGIYSNDGITPRMTFLEELERPGIELGQVRIDVTNNIELHVSGNLTVDGELFILTKTPALSSSTGTTGNFTYDSGYLYICIATDTWRRVTVNAW